MMFKCLNSGKYEEFVFLCHKIDNNNKLDSSYLCIVFSHLHPHLHLHASASRDFSIVLMNKSKEFGLKRTTKMKLLHVVTFVESVTAN